MSNIEWTGKTWNPISGCSRKSAGCQNCYAEVMTKRLAAIGQEKYQGLLNEQNRFNGVIKFDEKALLKPLSIKKPETFFVNSMSDLFHENVKDEWIDKVFAVMALTPQHTYQILTKRPERMKEWALNRKFRQVWVENILCEVSRDFVGVTLNNTPELKLIEKPLKNVWLGVSVENQKAAAERTPLLLETPAAIRFLSCEPLLSELNISRWLKISWQCSGCKGYFSGGWKMTCPDCGRKEYWCGSHRFGGRKVKSHPNFPSQSGIGIDWVIVGGESGHGARPCSINWIHSIVEQCKTANVSVFVKQLGSNATANYYDNYARDYTEEKGFDWECLNWDLRDGQPPMDAEAKFPTKGKGRNIEDFPVGLQIREMPV